MTKPPRDFRQPTGRGTADRSPQARPGKPKGETRPGRKPPPQTGSARPPPAAREKSPAPSGNVAQIWGTHAVAEALKSPRRELLRLFATESSAERIGALAEARGLRVDIVPSESFSGRLPRDAVHQGLLLETRPLEPIDLGDIPDEGTVLVLDQVTDPHNVGAILRTAAAFGVTALVMTDRHAPDFTGTLAKSASGGLEHVPVALVVNLARALDQLGERGFQRIGLDSEGYATLDDLVPQGPLALVLGAEGTGLRRLTRERCDALARLDMPGAIRSLNVSNACAAALTVVRLRRG